MKHGMLVAGMMLTFVASPAYALRVTNLDDVAHRVALYGRGETVVQDIAPGDTEYFTGGSQGTLSLVAPAAAPGSKAKKNNAKGSHDSVVHADGLLSGIIGNERSDGIPADPDSTYVIWPDGRLRVQSRIKDGRRG